MRSTFYGIEIGRTGINVSQKGLDVTGHNIANVDTVGYTRQRLINTAYDPYSSPMKFKNTELGAVGGGAHVKILDQIRSKFLDRQYRTESTLYSYYSSRTVGLSYVEALFESEQSATLSQGISDLFSAFNTIGTEANDIEQRTNVRSAALALCDSFQQVYDRLEELQDNYNTAAETIVTEINDYAENIAKLNRAILKYELDGQPANDLRDKRNLLLDELSTHVDITYYETDDNKLVVEINGTELVNYTDVKKLGTVSGVDPTSGNTFSYPTWLDANGNPEGSVLTAEQLGGELAAALDLRDGTTVDNQGIPYYMQQLNTLARAIVEVVNKVHSAGYTHPANPSGLSQTGINFFDPANVTAKTISLSKEVEESPYNIAASTVEVVLKEPNNNNLLQEGNQINAKSLYDIVNQKDIVLGDGTSIGSLYGFMSNIVLDVANNLSTNKKTEANHQIQLLSVDTQRTSVSGVSLDEEMTSLIKYQHAYSGSSRVITAMDEALETLINRMGRVGL